MLCRTHRRNKAPHFESMNEIYQGFVNHFVQYTIIIQGFVNHKEVWKAKQEMVVPNHQISFFPFQK